MLRATALLAVLVGTAILTSHHDVLAEGGTGYHFHLKSDATLCMDARMDRGATGTEVWVYKCNETDAQRWAVVETGAEHKWHPIIGPGGMCLDVRGAAKKSGTTVQLYPCHFGDNQRFKFDHSTGEIIEEHSGKCLGVAKLEDKQPVRLEKCSGGWNREWLFEYNRK
jgi:hypothetical protein